VAEPHVPLGVALQTVQNLAQPLAYQWQVALHVTMPPDLCDLPVAPLALRSILLTLLSEVIPQANQGALALAAAHTGSALALSVTGTDRAAHPLPFRLTTTANLQTAQNLAAFYGADLALPQEPDAPLAVTLTLPTPEQIPVLVIDDNADWIALQQRYVAGSRYRVIGASDPLSAVRLAGEVQPAIILLDVMMHNVDGWQILSELRHDPATAPIPIIICTILPVGELALSLGANAFLQKPVTQEQMVRMLEQFNERGDKLRG
jgi:CheY-like chemotaxis protein